MGRAKGHLGVVTRETETEGDRDRQTEETGRQNKNEQDTERAVLSRETF